MECLKKDLSFSHSLSSLGDECEVLQVKFKQSILTTKSPDNVVCFATNTIFEITKLFFIENQLKMQGYVLYTESAFDYPCSSTFIGVQRITRKSKHLRTFNCSDITNKCLKLTIGGRSYIIQMLHM